MSRYLLINRFRAGEGPIEGTSAHDEEMRDWELFNRALGCSGAMVWSLALDEPDDAVALTVDDAARPVRLAGRTGAPEGIFALYLLEVADRAAAEEWAARMPTTAYGTVEVRAVLSEEVS